jgi:hypothetical protein
MKGTAMARLPSPRLLRAGYLAALALVPLALVLPALVGALRGHLPSRAAPSGVSR